MRVIQDEGRIAAVDNWLEISVSVDAEGQSTADALLQWRPTSEAVKRLAVASATDAHLFVVIEFDGIEVQRQLFPLDWGKSYINFNHIGANSIHATIVWSDDAGDRSAKRLLLKQYSHKSFVEDVLRRERMTVVAIDERREQVVARLTEPTTSDDEKDELRQELEELNERQLEHYSDPFEPVINPDLFRRYLYDHDKAHQLGRVKVTVEVPTEMFGNNDCWPITRFFGNIWFDDKNPPKDNCRLRNRAFFTAITSPAWLAAVAVVVIAGYTIKFVGGAVVIGLLHIWGARNISYETFSWSWDYWPNDAWRDLEPSRWWTKEVWGKNESGVVEPTYDLRYPALVAINPPVILTWVIVIYLLSTTEVSTKYVEIPTIVIFALVIGLMAGITLSRYRKSEVEPEDEQKLKEQQRLQLQQRYSAVEGGQAQAPALRIWYREVKAEVCRPFARNA